MADMKSIHFPPPVADEEIRAILEDRKTVTRRSPFQTEGDFTILKGTYYDPDGRLCALFHKPDNCYSCTPFYAPYQRGDILYVRETWTILAGSYLYKADQKPGMKNPGKWHPSIHMPKEAARIFLRVTDARVERLKDIFKNPPGPKCQIVREGCSYGCDFIATWENTRKPSDRARYGWAANLWVWVIEFERIGKEEIDNA